MDATELASLLDQAAEKGAKRALESIGLHDDQAGHDIRDLRTLIDSWRAAKRTALQTVTKWFTLGVLGLLAMGWWMNTPHK